jgi:Tfp pilus assembly protein PilF
MSLLMDALKKAEQAKQQGSSLASESAGTAAAEPTLEPLAAPGGDAGTGEGPTKLPLKLEELDEEFIAHARGETDAAAARPAVDRRSELPPRSDRVPPRPPPAAKPVPAPDAAARAAARNVFAAKQPESGPVGRSFLLAVSALGLLAVAAIGIYFWLQLKPMASLVRPGLSAPPAAASQPLPPAAEPAPVPLAAAPASPPPPGIRVESGPLSAARAAPAPRPSTATARNDNPIRVASTRAAPTPALQQAYEALQAGDLAVAQTAYGRVLDGEPRNIDALQGLAALAMAAGRSGEAGSYYLRILEADPRDGTALAGLVALNGQSDPVAAESRLKTALAAQPELPVLHFALGNLYARQHRWSEAQQAYFKACAGAPDNPDFLFNLAVSLDQLHQPPLAAQFYQKALGAAAGRPAGFDRNQAMARLRELQP